MAIRGHSDQNGNLHQLVKSRAEDDNDLELQEWIKFGKYQSPLVQNELIQLMYLQVLRTLLADIRLVCFFSLIADETRDISGKEQLAAGVEKKFYFLGPQSNIENFLQVLKLIYTWIHPLYDANKLLN